MAKDQHLVIETTGMIHCLSCAENFIVGLEKEANSKEWKGVAFCPFCGIEQKHITLPQIPTSSLVTNVTTDGLIKR